MVMPRPMPLWAMEPVEIRCHQCHARDVAGEAPVLAFVEPVDPETDAKWSYLLISRPLRIGRLDAEASPIDSANTPMASIRYVRCP